MSDYNSKVYNEQGGGALVIEAADGGVIKGQASAGATPAQAAAIADISETAGTMSTEERGKFNAVLTVLRNIGAIASS
jgi:hypothetical protein